MSKKKGKMFEKDNETVGEPDGFLDSDDNELSEEHEIKIHAGEHDADVYTEEGREELTVDEGEIAPWEEGFAEGASGKGKNAVCAQCSAVLGDRDESVVERVYKGVLLFFCSEKCAKAGKKP